MPVNTRSSGPVNAAANALGALRANIQKRRRALNAGNYSNEKIIKKSKALAALEHQLLVNQKAYNINQLKRQEYAKINAYTYLNNKEKTAAKARRTTEIDNMYKTRGVTSLFKFAKALLWNKNPTGIAHGVTKRISRNYMNFENSIKQIVQLYANGTSSETTEKNSKLYGKKFIKNFILFVLEILNVVKSEDLTLPSAPTSPFISGIKNGWKNFDNKNIITIKSSVSRLFTRNLGFDKLLINNLINLIDTIVTTHKRKNALTEQDGKNIGNKIAKLLGPILSKKGIPNTSNVAKNYSYHIGISQGLKPLLLSQFSPSLTKSVVNKLTNPRAIRVAMHVARSKKAFYNRQVLKAPELAKYIRESLFPLTVAAVCSTSRFSLVNLATYGIIFSQLAKGVKLINLRDEYKCFISKLLEFAGDVAPYIHMGTLQDKPHLVIAMLIKAGATRFPASDLTEAIARMMNSKSGAALGVAKQAFPHILQMPMSKIEKFAVPDANTANKNRINIFNKLGLLNQKKYFNSVSKITGNRPITQNQALKYIKNKPEYKNILNIGREKLTQNNKNLLRALRDRARKSWYNNKRPLVHSSGNNK